MVRRVMWMVVLCVTAVGANETVAPADSLTQNITRSFQEPLFAPDKGHHFMASAFIAGISYYTARQEFNQSDMTANQMAIGVSLSVGIAKEIYDKVSGRGNPSVMDVVADVAGIAVGVVLLNVSSE